MGGWSKQIVGGGHSKWVLGGRLPPETDGTEFKTPATHPSTVFVGDLLAFHHVKHERFSNSGVDNS